MRSRRALPVLGAALLLLGSFAPAVAPPARAAEYTMETRATYDVRPDEGVIAVTVDITSEGPARIVVVTEAGMYESMDGGNAFEPRRTDD